VTSTEAILPPDDEFRFLDDCIEDFALPIRERPVVARRTFDVDGRVVSALAWGRSPAKVIFLHGGAQNAHTWDVVAMSLGIPMVAVDLPGHGRSGWRSDGEYSVVSMADDVVAFARALAEEASAVVGIGLGASVAVLVADCLGATSLVLVDSLAGLVPMRAASLESAVATSVSTFTSQHRFETFEELFRRAQLYSPGRSERALRRGLVHNTLQLPDGSWQWCWDPAHRQPRDYASAELELALDRFSGRILVVRGGESDVVDDRAAAAASRRHSVVGVITVDGAEHAVQGTHPIQLASAIRTFLHDISPRTNA
jgi:pimeloyl-ACP methyl ester carboxylesterase